MVRFWLYAILFLFVPLTYGLTLQENTILNQGNINYIFEEELVVDSFNLITNGIMIGDDRLLFVPKGGKVNIYFHSWSETDKQISILSSVPQDITFKITINNQKQYLYTGNTFHIDKVGVGLEPTRYEVINLGDEEAGYISQPIERLDWYEQRVLEIVLSSEIDEQGITHINTLKFTYLGLILTILGVIIAGVVIWRVF